MPRPRSRLRGVFLVLFFAAFGWIVTLTTLILRAAYLRPLVAEADAALVLGASSHAGAPSPVLQARIDFAVEMFNAGTVRRIIFTGGNGAGETIADSEAARRYAISKGVPARSILIETASHTTRENLVEARRLMEANQIKTCLLVSDPLHMWRATRLMKRIGIAGTPTATPYTKIRSLGEKLRFLGREVYVCHFDLFVRG